MSNPKQFNNKLTIDQTNFLKSLGFDPNSKNLKIQIQTFLEKQRQNQPKTTFLILHGGSEKGKMSTSEILENQNWQEKYFYKSFKIELEKKNQKVLFPKFSADLEAEYQVWQKELERELENLQNNYQDGQNRNFVLISHSLGCSFIVKFLSQNPEFSQKINKLFLIAPAVSTQTDFSLTELEEEKLAKMDFEKGFKTEIWISKNDKIVSNPESIQFVKYFPKVRVRKFENKEHFEQLSLEEMAILTQKETIQKTLNKQENFNKKLDLQKNSNLSQILTKIYTQIIPELQKQGKTWDIDYDFDRKENKRYESLKKRGCGEIIEVEI
jgi:predicted alpha/beta hydrolase family esterase